MAKIIITADDYGAIDGIDEGIIDAVKNSPIRSVAAFANSDTAVERLTRLKQEAPDDIEIGCHFTLTSGKPVLPFNEVPSVYDEDDQTYFREFTDFKYDMDADEVERELRAQLDVFDQAGIKVAHLSAHHNSLDYFEKFHKIFIKIAHTYYDNEIIPTRSPNVEPGIRDLVFREMVLVNLEDDNDDFELDLFSNFSNRITSDRKVQKLLRSYGYPGTRTPLCINGIHYGFPDKKVKSLRAIERKAPKRKKKLLNSFDDLKDNERPYEYVCHLIADDYNRYDDFVDQLETQDYDRGVNDRYFDGRMIEIKSIKSVSNQDLTDAGVERVRWEDIE